MIRTPAADIVACLVSKVQLALVSGGGETDVADVFCDLECDVIFVCFSHDGSYHFDATEDEEKEAVIELSLSGQRI